MNQLITQYLSEFDGSQTTVATYKATIKLFFRWMIDNHRIAIAPTRTDVTQYKQHLIRSGHAAKTIDNYLNSLKSFFRWTETNGYYENIAKHIRSTAPKFEMRKHPLTIPQVAKLINSIDHTTEKNLRDKAVISLLYFCGLRVIEVSRLTVADYGINTLNILGKGRNEKELIYLDSIAGEAIKDYLNARKEREQKINPESPLFLSYNHCQRNKLKHYPKASITCMVSDRLRITGLKTEKITAHSLRHSIAIHMIDKGATLYDVTQKLRHTDANMSRIYTQYIEKKKVQENQSFKAIQQEYQQTFNLLQK